MEEKAKYIEKKEITVSKNLDQCLKNMSEILNWHNLSAYNITAEDMSRIGEDLEKLHLIQRTYMSFLSSGKVPQGFKIAEKMKEQSVAPHYSPKSCINSTLGKTPEINSCDDLSFECNNILDELEATQGKYVWKLGDTIPIVWSITAPLNERLIEELVEYAKLPEGREIFTARHENNILTLIHNNYKTEV